MSSLREHCGPMPPDDMGDILSDMKPLQSRTVTTTSDSALPKGPANRQPMFKASSAASTKAMAPGRIADFHLANHGSNMMIVVLP